MVLELPKDEARIIPQLTNMSSARYDDFRKGAILLAQKNPDMDTRVITHFLEGLLQVEQKNSQMVGNFNVENKTRGSTGQFTLHPASLRRQAQQNYADYFISFSKNVPPQDQEVWLKYAKKMQRPSLVGGIFKQFYDGEEGGLKIGGVLAGLAGGYFIFKQLGGMQGGGLAWLATGVAAVGAAFLANSAINKISEYASGDKTNDFDKKLPPSRQPLKTVQPPAQNWAKAPPAPNTPNTEFASLVSNEALPYRENSAPANATPVDHSKPIATLPSKTPEKTTTRGGSTTPTHG